ncbi:MAG: hypothetical protein QOJ93_1862, partial [Actinomycetota bacterium]|jgi:hypothetical protein|nr:hypothetical protein [Actinomycetota bacterium]
VRVRSVSGLLLLVEGVEAGDGAGEISPEGPVEA